VIPLAEQVAVPGAYALALVELTGRWGVQRDELLAGLDLDGDRLADPATRVPVGRFRTLVQRALALTGEPGLALYLGLQMRISSHGFLGFAAMTSGTIREAIALAERFASTRTAALGFHSYVDDGQVSLVLEERVPLDDLREFVVVALLSMLAQIGAAITGRPLSGAADVTFAEPDYHRRLGHLFPGPVRFGQQSNRLIFATEVLDLPLVMADPVAAQLARAQCEKELDALGDDGQAAGRVRALLQREREEGGGFRSVTEVAKLLHVSERTLKRQLAASGTTFSDVLDELRSEEAMRLVGNRALTLEDVAERLGYSDVANFTRAFRRWTGTTPGTFRKR
jgi:AraC-like DNA-binding protein